MGTESLHDHSTRAAHNRHLGRGKIAATVVAVLFFVVIAAVLGPRIARSAQPPEIELSAIPNTAPTGLEANPSHDVAIEVVAPGKEGLELSARLTDDGGLIELPMHWTIRNMEGQTVYAGFTPGAEISVPPGDYSVDIRYDAVRLSSLVTLLEGNRLMVSYVLNAGGLRVLPRVQHVGLPDVKPMTRIFALGTRSRGDVIAVSETPGEIIRLPEGDYRLESRFSAGNVTAVIDVHVTAGRLSGVDIDHKAGLARLAFVGEPDQAVEWKVSNSDGHQVVTAEGINADVVLLPGTYTASAQVGNEILSATFKIASGEARDIILGN